MRRQARIDNFDVVELQNSAAASVNMHCQRVFAGRPAVICANVKIVKQTLTLMQAQM